MKSQNGIAPHSDDHKIITLELFRLDEIDRHVFFWLAGHNVLRNSLKSWLEFIYNDYQRRTSVTLNIGRLLKESECVIDGVSIRPCCDN